MSTKGIEDAIPPIRQEYIQPRYDVLASRLYERQRFVAFVADNGARVWHKLKSRSKTRYTFQTSKIVCAPVELDAQTMYEMHFSDRVPDGEARCERCFS